MNTTSPDLAAVKADLQAKLERIAALEAKKAEILREEAELAVLLAGGHPSRQAPTKPVLVAPDESSVPTTQKACIMWLLAKFGPLTRDELFTKLEPTGKRPAKPDQLSAILSREKKEGRLAFDSSTFRWSIPPATDSSI
jgi:hypothetical protein